MANRAQSFNARALYHLGVPPLETGLDGRGVAIGFVDYGFDILHRVFETLPAADRDFAISGIKIQAVSSMVMRSIA